MIYVHSPVPSELPGRVLPTEDGGKLRRNLSPKCSQWWNSYMQYHHILSSLLLSHSVMWTWRKFRAKYPLLLWNKNDYSRIQHAIKQIDKYVFICFWKWKWVRDLCNYELETIRVGTSKSLPLIHSFGYHLKIVLRMMMKQMSCCWQVYSHGCCDSLLSHPKAHH